MARQDKVLENQLLRTCERHLKALARADPTFTFRKRHGSPMALTGDPDLTGLWRGHHFEIELKRPGQHPTPLQSVRLAEWSRAGASCFVAHTLAEFHAVLDTLREQLLPKSAAPPQ
jgi:hypothetical protein